MVRTGIRFNGDGWDHDRGMEKQIILEARSQKKGKLCIVPLMTTLRTPFFLSKGIPPVP